MALTNAETSQLTSEDILFRIANTDWDAVTAETGLDAATIIKQWAPGLDKEEVEVLTQTTNATGD